MNEPDNPPVTDVVLIVDVANVMGSRPDGWWRDRRAAASRIISALEGAVETEADVPELGTVRVTTVVAVVEGAARGATGAAAGVEIVEAERDGDSTIVAIAHETKEAMIVVTADRGLRQRLPGHAGSVGPQWLNELIGR